MKAIIVLLQLAIATVFAGETRLQDMTCESAKQGWGALQLGASVGGQPMKIAGRTFAHGLGTHAASEIVYELDGALTNFSAWVGVDDEMKGYTNSSVVFQVFADGIKLFDSGMMRLNDVAKPVSVPLAGVNELKLVVTDAGDGIHCDHADWAEAVLLGGALPAPKPGKYLVSTPALKIELNEDGEITGKFSGRTRLAGCRTEGSVVAKKISGGGYAFMRTLTNAQGRRARVSERFTPAKDSIRWEMEVVSDDEPWSAAIETAFTYPATAATRFWTAWSDPEHQTGEWRDPLVLRPVENTSWTYGGRMNRGDYIALPLATFAEPATDTGLSLVFSPEDSILCGARLTASAAGAMRFSRTNYRLGGGKTVRFALDLVPHEADWRGGLRWMKTRYAKFFEPPNPHASAMAGCGAYSGDENPIDVAKFKAMAFRINWKLSDDFPYMGMFIPPVTNADETWERSCDEKAPPNKLRTTSCRQLNDYARYMRTNGFYVLNYFNVTEFGKNMAGKATKQPGDPDLWQDPRAFLATQLPGAIHRGGDATCYHASAVDPGDPAFQKFILEQADRHNHFIPDSFGICIDRMDWLDNLNFNADDGITWAGGKPARSLCVGWQNLLAQLGPKMHDADKVIFVNPIYSRFDMLRQVDGIYTEFGQDGRSLNTSALMGLGKPVLAWSYNETIHQPDPDAFMQRHLHLGVFPTAPYPWNNHCITPEQSADRLFLDYGPLLDALRGKNWALAPHCIKTRTPGVKVNLFQVPGGHVAPVTFGGTNETAVIQIRNLPNIAGVKCDELQPGVETPLPLQSHFKDGVLEITVPLKRGCALVHVLPVR